jgi:undecaprenyl-diphosphatase
MTKGRDRVLIVSSTVLLGVTSVCAGIWSRWPGDAAGVRAFQGLLNDTTRPVIRGVNYLGEDHPVVWGMTATVIVVLAYRRQLQMATLLFAVMTIGMLSVTTLKWLVQRPSPEPGQDFQVLGETARYAFPSGHVAISGLFFGTLLIFVSHHWIFGGIWVRRTLITSLCVPIVLMGPSRLAWGVHWPSDVLAGYFLAATALLIVRLSYIRLTNVEMAETKPDSG